MSKLTRLPAVILAGIMILSFAGCKGEEAAKEPADEAEVTAAATELIQAAVEVNRIFFWEGLPQKEVVDEESGENVISLGDADYVELAEEYRYLTQGDLMSKAKAVYTESYCEDIENIAFVGESSVIEDEVLYPRYITDVGYITIQETWESMSTEDLETLGITEVMVNVMKINKKISEEGLPERIPDIGTLEIVEIKHDSAVVSVEFTCEGETESQNVTLKLEDNGWRLDSPTY